MINLLKIDNLCGGYPNEKIIKNISFSIEKNDFVGIIGPNGAGKSTLLKLMSKVLSPDSGKVFLNDKNITQIKLKDFCKEIAFVSQNTVINFPFSVWEIVLLGRIPHLGRLNFETEKDFVIAKNALNLTRSFHLKDKEIDQLSSGERQLVIMAKALAQEPSILLLDEPTSHLDIGHQIQILDLLKKLNHQNKITVVMVLHDLNLASEYCDKIILLNKGEIYKQGTPGEVLTYQNIEAVYKTVVVVNTNPISKKPYVLVVPGKVNDN